MAIRVNVWYGDFSWKVKSVFFNAAQNNKCLCLWGFYRLQMLHQPWWVRSREKLRPKITPWYNSYLQRSLTRCVAVSRVTVEPRVYACTHTCIHTDARTHVLIWVSLQLWSCAKNFPRPKLFNYLLRWSHSLSRCSSRHHNQHQNHRHCNDATYSLKQSRVSDADVQKFTI